MGAGHKTKPRMLIEFEAMVDLTIGFFNFCKTYNPELLKPELLNISDDEIRNMRSSDKEFIYSIFNSNISHNAVDEFYNEVKETHTKDLYFNSPLIQPTETIATIFGSKELAKPGLDDICHLIVFNELQSSLLKARFPSLKVIEHFEDKKFETDAYARIILASPKNYSRFDTTFTIISIIGFPENISIIEGKEMVGTLEDRLNIGFTNTFEITALKRRK